MRGGESGRAGGDACVVAQAGTRDASLHRRHGPQPASRSTRRAPPTSAGRSTSTPTRVTPSSSACCRRRAQVSHPGDDPVPRVGLQPGLRERAAAGGAGRRPGHGGRYPGRRLQPVRRHLGRWRGHLRRPVAFGSGFGIENDVLPDGRIVSDGNGAFNLSGAAYPPTAPRPPSVARRSTTAANSPTSRAGRGRLHRGLLAGPSAVVRLPAGANWPDPAAWQHLPDVNGEQPEIAPGPLGPVALLEPTPGARREEFFTQPWIGARWTAPVNVGGVATTAPFALAGSGTRLTGSGRSTRPASTTCSTWYLDRWRRALVLGGDARGQPDRALHARTRDHTGRWRYRRQRRRHRGPARSGST